jgi:hypothetical protein
MGNSSNSNTNKPNNENDSNKEKTINGFLNVIK